MQIKNKTLFKVLKEDDKPLSLFDFKELISDEIEMNNHFISVLTDGYTSANDIELIRETGRNINIYRTRIEGLKSLLNRIELTIDRHFAAKVDTHAEESSAVYTASSEEISPRPVFHTTKLSKLQQVNEPAGVDGSEEANKDRESRKELYAMESKTL